MFVNGVMREARKYSRETGVCPGRGYKWVAEYVKVVDDAVLVADSKEM